MEHNIVTKNNELIIKYEIRTKVTKVHDSGNYPYKVKMKFCSVFVENVAKNVRVCSDQISVEPKYLFIFS